MSILAIIICAAISKKCNFPHHPEDGEYSVRKNNFSGETMENRDGNYALEMVISLHGDKQAEIAKWTANSEICYGEMQMVV